MLPLDAFLTGLRHAWKKLLLDTWRLQFVFVFFHWLRRLREQYKQEEQEVVTQQYLEMNQLVLPSPRSFQKRIANKKWECFDE
jgi:hypothetical protein